LHTPLAASQPKVQLTGEEV
jgi:hypothetical protein